MVQQSLTLSLIKTHRLTWSCDWTVKGWLTFIVPFRYVNRNKTNCYHMLYVYCLFRKLWVSSQLPEVEQPVMFAQRLSKWPVLRWKTKEKLHQKSCGAKWLVLYVNSKTVCVYLSVWLTGQRPGSGILPLRYCHGVVLRRHTKKKQKKTHSQCVCVFFYKVTL